MAVTSLPQDPAGIIAEVELFFDSLPAKRRGRRTRAEIDAPVDDSAEAENYAPTDAAPEHDPAALAEFKALLRQLGKARSDVVAEIVIAKIYRLLDLAQDGEE